MKKLFILLLIFSFALKLMSQVTQQNIDKDWSGIATGTNTYSVTISKITSTSPYNFQTIYVQFSNGNTGASTLKLNSYSAIGITLNGSALVSGDIITTATYILKYNSATAKWEMQPFVAGSGASTNWKITGNSGTTAGTNFVGNTDSVDLVFKTNNIERMRILANGGNVGIGINAATAKLHIVGTNTTTATYAAKFENSSNVNLLNIRNGGQIEAGDANANLFFGLNSGVLSLTTGANNTAVGVKAGRVIADGFRNVAIGWQSMTNTSDGNSNVAIGWDNLSDNISGIRNVAVGYQTLDKNLSHYNNALGYSALYNNTNGQHNVGIGYTAGYTNATGNYNTAIGNYALYQNTGSNNVGIGYAAGTYGTWNNTMWFDPIDRIDSATQRISSPIFIQANSTVSSQTVTINGILKATSANLTTPVLGTPTSGTLTNCTGLPVAGTLLTATSPLSISTNTISITSPLPIANGGTNATVLTGLALGSSTCTQQAEADSSTKIANTGFVQYAIGKQLASYYPLLRSYGNLLATAGANTYYLSSYSGVNLASNNMVSGGSGSAQAPATIIINSADYPSVNGRVPVLRIRASLFVNDAAPTGNFTFGLYPLSTPGTSGGAGLRIWTIGTVTSGSDGATVSAPAADSENLLVGSDFALPANGIYAICVLTTGTIATSSFVEMSASLQIAYK